ncbi:MAG: ABC transporter permease [Candidatus Levybacteria bacterium]|nr:ABC transporter permease [Candidatus Levybacteria bacterium]
MNFKELVSAALTALRGNLLRTLLTMLGIIIGIASVILIIALGDGATQSISSQISSFGTNSIFIVPDSPGEGPPQGVQSLTLEDAKAIQNDDTIQNISLVSAAVSTSGPVSANGQNATSTIQGISASYAEIQSLEVAQGEFITVDDEDSLGRVAVLGSEIAGELFGVGSEPVGESIKIDNRSFRIIGVLAEADTSSFTNPNTAVYIPVTTAMKILLGQNHVGNITVLADDPEFINSSVGQIETLLRERHDIVQGAEDDFAVRSSQQALSTLGNVTGLLTALFAGIAGISLVVGGIGIMNIMLVTVTERTREIGLLKAIGARQKDILTQFLIEATVLTLVGGAIGMILGIALAVIITKVANLPLVISPIAILASVGVSAAVGILFGYYPAQRAAKLSPIDALRHE